MAKVLSRNTHSLQDDKIYRNRYYVWCYNDKYQINLIPISFDTYDLAKYTLTKCFGKGVFKTLNIISGRLAIKNKFVLGKNSFRNPISKKIDTVRKWYIPPEWKKDKHTKRHFLLRIYRAKTWEEGIKNYYSLTHNSKTEDNYG